MRKDVEKVAKKVQKSATVNAIAKLNKSISNTVICAIDGNKYRLRNLGYLEGNKAYNNNQYLQASPTTLSAAALTLDDESQIWTLQKTEEGYWRPYNEKHQVWMGKPAGTSTNIFPTKNSAEAGTFMLTSDREGKTIFSEQNTTNVNYPCFHLSQTNTLVTWNASAPSKWEIIAVDADECGKSTKCCNH
jgi:hypothetical protein